jgi:xanthine dehydrogenase YagR molybdenum-binding subunit
MADEKRRMPVGIVSPSSHHRGEMAQVDRAVPSPAEPPAWPVNEKLSVVGKPAQRIDGRLKVTGRARYTADVRLPGMLYARVVRSAHAHARVKSIDTSAAERSPGVRAVHVLDHLRDSAQLSDPSKEMPSRYPIVRYAGQPIAAVAATTPAEAEDAARLVRVEYEPLPFVVDLDDARKADAPLVFPGPAQQGASGGGGGGAQGVNQVGNVRGPKRSGSIGAKEPGDPEKGFAAAKVIVEGTYRTQVQTHSAMETHGVVADWKPDMLTVHASTQGTASVRDELAEVFELPKSRIRVVTEFMGGGFGAKFGVGNFGVLATHLSKKAGAPVRLMLDRREEHTAVGNRPSSLQRLRIGAAADGKLTALYLECHGTGGTGLGAGAGRPAQAMYQCPQLLTEEYDVFTNAGPSAAFRAPGHPQGAFALEQAIDELAEKLGIDPIELRDRIDVDPDPDSGNGDSQSRRIERRIGAEKIGWSKRRPAGSDQGRVKRGIGMAQGLWYRFADMDSACEVRILRDGSVEVLSGVQDIGGGIRTALAQVVAEELGLTPADITVRIGDTTFPPGPGSGGSTTTNSITPPTRNAAYQAARSFLAQVAPALGVEPGALALQGGKVVVTGDGGRSLGFRQAAAKMRTEQVSATVARAEDYRSATARKGPKEGRPRVAGYGGVQFAAVRVDTETGIIHVERVVAVHDCGRPLNPLALESQINGGVLQGISYALYENRVLDRGRGLMLNPNFEQYKILGAREVPAIEVVLIEEYRGLSSTDAGGIGEPSTVPTAGAVANAVHNAIGARVRELPMTPARVLAALAGKESP